MERALLSGPANKYTPLRQQMVDEQIAARGLTDERVLRAMRQVPRHLFVPEALRPRAYEDGPLPIGAGQTISQPYIVAYMTQLLRLRGDETVLEIGVGSGYQTAVLAQLARFVIGLERIPQLLERTIPLLASLSIENVGLQVSDGTAGFPEQAPYDAILVAAAAPGVPRSLCEQLADGGRLVIPVADAGGEDQTLERIWRRGHAFHAERLSPVRFVPLVGEFGFAES